MSQDNTAATDKLMDISNCRVNRDFTGLAACLTKESCRWAIPVLEIGYCTHPLVLQIPGCEDQHNKKNFMPFQFKNPQEPEWNNCRVRLLGNTDIVECLVDVIRCQWVVPFGDSKICSHPSARQFVISGQP